MNKYNEIDIHFKMYYSFKMYYLFTLTFYTRKQYILKAIFLNLSILHGTIFAEAQFPQIRG